MARRRWVGAHLRLRYTRLLGNWSYRPDMFHKFLALIAASIITFSAVQAADYTFDDAASVVTTAMTASENVKSVTRTAEDALSVEFENGTETSVYLGNLTATLNADPDNETETVAQFVSVLFRTGGYNPETTPDQLRKQLRPIVRHSDYVDAMKETAKNAMGGNLTFLMRPIAADYWLIVAIDNDDSIQVIPRGELEALALTDDEIFDQSLTNFSETLLPLLQREQTNGAHMLLLDGNYEASLIAVGNYWDGEAERLGDSIVMVAPARDVVLYCKRSDTVCIDIIHDLAKENIKGLSNAISDTLLEWNNKGWREYSR